MYVLTYWNQTLLQAMVDVQDNLSFYCEYFKNSFPYHFHTITRLPFIFAWLCNVYEASDWCNVTNVYMQQKMSLNLKCIDYQILM